MAEGGVFTALFCQMYQHCAEFTSRPRRFLTTDCINSLIAFFSEQPSWRRHLYKTPRYSTSYSTIHDERPTPPTNPPQTRTASGRARSRCNTQAWRRPAHPHSLPVRSPSGHSQGAGEQATRGSQVRGTRVSVTYYHTLLGPMDQELIHSPIQKPDQDPGLPGRVCPIQR